MNIQNITLIKISYRKMYQDVKLNRICLIKKTKRKWSSSHNPITTEKRRVLERIMKP